MFDFGQDAKKKLAAAPFSLDKADISRAKRRSSMSRVEWRLVLFLPVFLGVMIWTIYDWRNKFEEAMKLLLEPIPALMVLTPMQKPVIDGMAVPPPAEITAERAAAAVLVAAGKPPPLTADALDAAAIAWACERTVADQSALPLPSRLAARDLVLADHVGIGTALIVEGRLDDRLPLPVAEGEKPWQRLIIALEDGQYVMAIATPESADLLLGRDVRLTGRLLGYSELPAEAPPTPTGAPAPAPAAGSPTAGRQTVPVLLGRTVVEARRERASDDPLAAYHRPWSMPDDIFNDVDDFRLWTETRSYYHLLGQVLRDRSTPAELDASPNGNLAADDLHLRPAEFRGKPFHITGYVYQAWEDSDVARDQPFGVGRVVRILLWRRDIAPVTETFNGKTERKEKLVLRLYEFAAITNQPVPERGMHLTTRGRFLKKRAIPVQPDAVRDQANGVLRQSDRVYTWLFVTDDWTVLEGPSEYNFGPLAWVISGVGLVGLVIGVWWWLREVRGAGRELDARVRHAYGRKHPLPAPGGASPSGPEGQAPPPP